MGARGETLAQQFETKAKEATDVFERLSAADWTTVTSAEKWPIGVVAHHIAVAHEIIGGLIRSIASGQARSPFSMDAIHAMNAQHAQEHAGCTKSETLALHQKNAAATAALVRGLGDAELGRSAVVIDGLPEMTAEQLAGGLLVGHVNEHLGSIRATLPGSAALARALELLAAGDWKQAHEIVQKDDSARAAWLHGIVHILEGDLKNAKGWYQRAGRPFPGPEHAQAEVAAARLEVVQPSA